MLFFLKKWNELKDVKAELALRDWFYGTKISLSMCTSKEPLTFLVNVEGRDKGVFSEEDFIVVIACVSQYLLKTKKNQLQSHLCMRIFIKKVVQNVFYKYRL